MGIVNDNYAEAAKKMEKAIESVKKELSHVRTGRANPSLFDGIRVEYYGSLVPINQVASISIPEARLVLIQPWEKTMLPVIEKAINASGLGLNPQNDGNIIRVPIPPLSEERRKELFKICKRIAEEGKVAVRNIRREANEKDKQAQKEGSITEDEAKRALDAIQKLTDKNIQTIDALLAAKEKEIMES